MPQAAAHKWQFRARFRRGAFGWKPQTVLQCVKEAVSEIKKVAHEGEAIRCAEACRDAWASDLEIDQLCLEILLSSGFTEEAYRRYGRTANRRSTCLTLQAAENAECADVAEQRMRELVAQEPSGERFVTRVLGHRLGLS